jgi:hypothetical protein
MNVRKITSLTALIAFVLLILSSTMLYIVPSGRVAYWAGWELWGLSKEQWGEVHINLGALLLLSLILHIFYNWGALVSYMRNRSKQFRLFTPDFCVALVIGLFVFFGTLVGAPPMSLFLELGTKITEDANEFYGEAPYGHAELSAMNDFAEKVGIDLDQGLERLRAAGYEVTDVTLTVGEIADANEVAPYLLYEVMKPEETSTEVTPVMLVDPPGGIGKRQLAEVCESYGLDLATVIAGFEERGLSASAEQTLKEIGTDNRKDPHAVYELIYEISQH